MPANKFMKSLSCACTLLTSSVMASEDKPVHMVPVKAQAELHTAAETLKSTNTIPHSTSGHATSKHTENTPVPVPANDQADTTLETGRFGPDNFLATRRRLILAIGEGESGLSLTPANTRDLLNLAEFFLSNAFLVEGRSILESLENATLPPKQMERKQVISTAIRILNWQGKALTERETQSLESQKFWPKRALFQALYHLKKNNPQNAKPLLEQAAKQLANLSSSIQELILPQLLEAAIYTQSWAEAKEFARLISEHNQLKKSSAYQYLLGITAESGDDYLVAFDNYVTAAKGEDQWAQRARLALVELGIKTNTLSLREVRDLLDQSRYLWRGDMLALKNLNQLANAELALDRLPAALEVLGEIIYLNLDDTATQTAKQQADLVLKKFYEQGAAGKIKITEFILGHQRIANDYRFLAGYDIFSEMFADRMLVLGASSEAAREYETTYNYLSVAQDLGLFKVAAARLDKLSLKRVQAFIQGGQYDEALPILALGPQSESSEMADEFTFLKAELANHTGNLSGVLNETVFKSSKKYLKIKAKAYLSMEDWKNALETYNLLWMQDERAFTLTEAINMLLAAYHNNNTGLALKLAQRFPTLTEAPLWQKMATELLENTEIDGVLRNDIISGNLSEANNLLDVMKTVNRSSRKK